MMRVMHLIKTTRGATWALRQVQTLVKIGVEVDVVLPDYSGLAHQYKEAGACVHVMETDIARLRLPHQFLKARKYFRELVKVTAPDVIHSHFVGTTLFMRLAMRMQGPPRIFQVPGPLHLENPLTRNVEIGSATGLDHWIASCKFTRETYRRAGVSDERLGLSYYGIDHTQFRVERPINLIEMLNVSRETAIIGMVAHIYAPKFLLGQTRGLKGHEDLIDAVHILLKGGRDVALVFVGGPWVGAEAYANKLVHYAQKRLGHRVMFLGHRPDVADLYAGFNLAVHPSHSENLGGAVESLALEIPTIATDVGGFPDVVIPNETGWLVPAKSPKALAIAIADALDNPERAKRHAQRGAKLIGTLLDVQRNGLEVSQYYKRFSGLTSRIAPTNPASLGNS